MFRYAYLIVRDAERADDVTQDAVWRVYRNMRHYDKSRPFRPWALGITRNLARNHNRARGRYQHWMGRFVTQQAKQSASLESFSEAQAQARDLHQAVSRLASGHQDVIYARYFLELSVAECAEMLGLSEGTVKSRSHRALKQLKAVVEQHYPQLAEGMVYD